jgi:hypothetical protein
MFARVKGDYVIAAQKRELLDQAVKAGRTLADEFGPRLPLLEGRDLLVHVNFEPIRPMALGGIAQAAQMAPMMAMMMAQQAGGDPTSATAMFTAVVDGAQKFVEQVSYIDITIGVSDSAGDITLTTGYKDGPIKTYLANQKPAGVSFFTEMEDKAFFLAMGAHFPGEKSPFVDYVCEKMVSAMGAAPAAEGDAGGDAAGARKNAEKAVGVFRELATKVQGQEMSLSFGPAGLEIVGDYLGADTAGIAKLVKQSMTEQQEVVQQMKGMQYESIEPQTIGGVQIDQFRMKIDPGNPAAALFGGSDGQGCKFALGESRGRVRFCMGDDQAISRAFGAKGATPMASSKLVVEALSSLPTTRTAVLLIDPAAVLPFLGPIMGMPPMDPIAPGPPVALSVSLVGDPARVDIHIPFRAIERVLQALTPERPM